MIDVITLAVAEKYTRDSLVGLGALKGAPCTISKVEEEKEKLVKFNEMLKNIEERIKTLK